MSGSAQPASRPDLLARLGSLLNELYGRSNARKYGMTAADFNAIVGQVARKYLPADCGDDEARELCSGLHVEELALARACAAGNEAAWEDFLVRYREKLYGAAYSIAREDSAARELADSLYASLFGTTIRDGERVSKLSSYMGRGSLEGWLRTVLAQEYVNRYRSQKRLISLEQEEEQGAQFVAKAGDPVAGADPRLEKATGDALAALNAEERFILVSYFLDGRTLAETARLLRVHESTISRKVEKITVALRKNIRDGLVRLGMSRRQAEEALEADVRDLAVDVRAHLAQESSAAAFHQKESGDA